MVLYASVEIFDGLIMIALKARPLDRLSAVNRHRSMLRHRARRALQALAIALWIAAVLQRLLLREQLFEAALRFLDAEFAVGSIHISAGELLAFGLGVGGAVGGLASAPAFLNTKRKDTRVSLETAASSCPSIATTRNGRRKQKISSKEPVPTSFLLLGNRVAILQKAISRGPALTSEQTHPGSRNA